MNNTEHDETRRLTVGLGERSYNIDIGPGLIASAGPLIAAHLSRPRVAVITDENVAHLHLDRLTASLGASGISVTPIIVAPGEATKSLHHLGIVINALLDNNFERRDTLIAFGGGVIGDLAGFAAATIHRGVNFVQMPTTLLAQVDSSVGGKTGINTRHGKNLAGAFHQPVQVIADTTSLATLPPREFRAGYAELVKHGILGDRSLFEWLDATLPNGLSQSPKLPIAIARSCTIKARIVEEDETETGRRALLNLGHTFAHALEAALGYDGDLLHGEAVAIGTVCALNLSAQLGICSRSDADRIRTHFTASGLPTSLAKLSNRLPTTGELIELMGHDKKVVSGRKRLILARGIGEAFITDDVDDASISDVIDNARAQ